MVPNGSTVAYFTGTNGNFNLLGKLTCNGADLGTTSAGNITCGSVTASNEIKANLVGKGFSTKEGSNARQGVATLSAGTVVVSNTVVTANSRIILTAQSLGTVTVPAALAISARTAGTSFTIKSSASNDTSVVAYEIFEPA